MNISIDMRPMYTPEMGAGALYCEDFLRALFRNHPSDVFYLWTTGERRRKDLPTFAKYSNVHWVHTSITQSRLSRWISFFSYPYIDDIIETQAMKEGHMSWISQLDAAIFLMPTPSPLERDCLKVQIVEHCSFLHFSEVYADEITSLHTVRHYNSQLESADLVLVPSKFVKEDLLETCKKSEEEKITVVGAGVVLEIQQKEDTEELVTERLEKELFLQHQKEEEATLESEVLPEQYIFARGVDWHGGNVEIVMRAYEMFCVRFGDEAWEMVIEESFVGDLENLKGRSNITILPPLTQSERYKVLSQAQLFLYPALYDGDGTAIIQSMREKCPVICSTYGALPEVYRDTVTDFDPLSEFSILKAMKKVFKNAPYREDIVQKAFERASHSRFGWDDIAAHVMHRIAERIEEKSEEDDE